jgi:thiol-disulfide isomerase/thioredoxin
MAEELTKQRQVEDLMSPEGGAAIIDFWSPTCGPCLAMAPAFDAVSQELDEEPIRFVKINTAAHPKLAAPFRVRAVPTILFVNNGEILDVSVGALQGPALQKKAKWLLSKSRGEGFFKRVFG